MLWFQENDSVFYENSRSMTSTGALEMLFRSDARKLFINRVRNIYRRFGLLVGAQ